ncbi:MAG TPA: ABC transporter permease, partial [Solirubrobacteraceae bacterium]|nr:ABC transporter permease [Solirubrobacteraceae bacterium]
MLLLFGYLLRAWRRWRGPAAGAGPAAVPDDESATAPAAAAAGAPAASASARSRPRARSAASRGWIALLAHQTRYELLSGLRNPRARFLTFFFPVAMLVIFAGVFHGTTTVAGARVSLSRYFVFGILAMSIVLSSYASLLTAIATLRETGVLKRRRATPVPPTVLIGAQALAAVATVAITGTILLALAKLLYGIGLSPGAIAATACTAVLGALAFACIGYAVSGLIGSPESAQPLVQATTMPLWFLSGVLIPTQNLSGALRAIGSVFPVEHLAAALHLASVHASFASCFSAENLLVLLL